MFLSEDRGKIRAEDKIKKSKKKEKSVGHTSRGRSLRLPHRLRE
jgi:hypothetical protein